MTSDVYFENGFEYQTPDEATQLGALAAALRLGQRFQLLCVVCNGGEFCRHLMREVQNRLPEKTIQQMDYSGRALTNLLNALQTDLNDRMPDALFISGLEHAIPTEEANAFLIRLAMVREIPCSVVLWIPEYILLALNRHVPHFLSGRSGLYFFDAPQEKRSEPPFLPSENYAAAYGLTPAEQIQRLQEIQDLLDEMRSSPSSQRDLHAEIRMMQRLTSLHYTQAQYAEAERIAEEALNLYRRESLRSGETMARLLTDGASVCEAQGQYEKAEAYCLQAIEAAQKTYGEGHFHFANYLNNAASFYLKQGRYEEAEPFAQQAFEIRKRTLPNDHPQLTHSLLNVAGLYEYQNRLQEAELLLLQALSVAKRNLPENHPDAAGVHHNLARLYVKQGRYAEAEARYLQALEMCRAALVAEHPLMALCLDNLGILYYRQGRRKEAEPLFGQAAEIRRKRLGEHPDTAQSLNNLAAVYDVQGRNAEAEPLYQEAIRIAQATLGDAHPHTQTYRENYVQMLRAKSEAIERGERIG